MARRKSSRGYWDVYEKNPTIVPKDGIKAQNKRGAFGTSWWAKSWISVLEGFEMGARLARGRTYARKGQVLDINIDKGSITARVQGSRRTPYKVAIEVKTLREKDWAVLAKALAEKAAYAAKLLNGSMPEDIGQVFQRLGFSLFPEEERDLVTDCSCPDWANPCKHVAAVYFLVGEEFDRDPFLIFRLRGLTREGLTDLLGTVPGTALPREPTLEPEPLPIDPQSFWTAAETPRIPPLNAPTLAAPLVKRLGSLSYWRGDTPFIEIMETYYTRAGAGVTTFFADLLEEEET